LRRQLSSLADCKASAIEGRAMNITKALAARVAALLRDEEGAQVVEYALIIAVVSIALVVALSALTGTSFSGWIGRVQNCLTGTAANSCS
jgi:pilus assembly protein Flp/PilA